MSSCSSGNVHTRKKRMRGFSYLRIKKRISIVSVTPPKLRWEKKPCGDERRLSLSENICRDRGGKDKAEYNPRESWRPSCGLITKETKIKNHARSIATIKRFLVIQDLSPMPSI